MSGEEVICQGCGRELSIDDAHYAYDNDQPWHKKCLDSAEARAEVWADDAAESMDRVLEGEHL